MEIYGLRTKGVPHHADLRRRGKRRFTLTRKVGSGGRETDAEKGLQLDLEEWDGRERDREEKGLTRNGLRCTVVAEKENLGQGWMDLREDEAENGKGLCFDTARVSANQDKAAVVFLLRLSSLALVRGDVRAYEC
ncbi:uncharacterized protein LOC116202593 [Punica granatum]|uniref:Uncharacterized protein LOC116202593 n=1 Tax=Punica granatum TaxID=22663 RepID=A0A6P8CZ63_PUNGR|nr:uncharacterized protein LOC116202593 [Punica granatum]